MPTGYTPPAGNAVNLNFTGAYTPPVSGSVILNFKNINAYVLTADAGSYAIAGTAASLKVGRHLFAYQQLIPGLAAGGFQFEDISGWTSSLAGFTLSGSILVTDTSGGSAFAYRAIAGLNPGQQYTLQGYLIDVTAPMGMAVGTTAGGQQLGSVLSFANGVIFTSNPVTNPAKSITFIAPPSGTIYVSLFTGTSGQGRVGYVRLEQNGFYQLVGTDATIQKTGRILTASPGVYTMTGSPASLKVGRRLVADPGVYTQVRTSARLLVGRRLVADPGAYTITPSAADISYIIGFYLHAEKGSYALQGSDARLLVGHRLPADPGSYSLTGSAVSWVYRRVIKAAPGTYALIGSSVRLLVGYRLKATPGTYLITGTDANLINRRLTAQPGNYSVVGTAAKLLVGRRIVATPGVYTVIGTNAALLYSRRLVAQPGSYALLGTDARLLAGRHLMATPGTYSLAGTAARLRRGYTVHAVPGVYTLTGTAARILMTRRMMLEAGVYRSSWPDVALVPTWRPRNRRAIAVGFAASRYVSVEPQNRRVAVEPQDRRVSVEPAPRRYAAVEPRDKELEGGSMLKWPEKDPDEVLDYELDWADPEEPRLEAGETLVTSVWTIVEGNVVINSSNFTPQGLATVWLSGGTSGTKCILNDRVTTSAGRTYDKEVSLRVRTH